MAFIGESDCFHNYIAALKEPIVTLDSMYNLEIKIYQTSRKSMTKSWILLHGAAERSNIIS